MKQTFVLLLLALGLLQGTLHAQKTRRIVSRSDTSYSIAPELPQDSALTQMLRPYKAGMDTQMKVVLGYTDIPLSKAQPECTLGNFMTDALLACAKRLDPKVEAAIVNYGGIRLTYISPGPISRGSLYELMPFDNVITVIEIPGSVLRTLCDHMAARKGWPVSGLQFVIKGKKAEQILLRGMELNDNRIYRIAVNDYMANGGDQCDFLKPLKKRYTSVAVRNALADYLTALTKEGKPLHPNIENRISYAE